MSSVYSVVPNAVGLLGDKAVPDLLKVFEDEKTWDDDLERAIGSVFRELGSKAAAAVDPLVKVVNDDSGPVKRRIRAISMLNCIGLSAHRAAPDLAKLREDSDAGIRDAVTKTLVTIRAPEAGAIMAHTLEQLQDPFQRKLVLRDIAELGANGKSAAPVVAKYLADEDWEVRVGAARALGYIGAEDSARNLIQSLSSEEDWRLVWCAAGSLGRLKSEQAIPALTKLSTSHWYPPVREIAIKALAAIRGGKPLDQPDEAGNFAVEFFSYEEAGLKVDTLERGDEKNLRFPVLPHRMKDVTAKIQGIAALKADGVPFLGIEVEGGYLAAFDKGEWGGGILFVDRQGKPTAVMGENAQAIYRTENAVLAVTGLAHMMMNEGAVYKLSKNADSRWEAKPWRILPGAPQFSRMLKNGRLFVSCYGGIVTISPKGEMKTLSRKEATDAPPHKASERP